MDFFEWLLKIIFYFWLGVFGIGFADLAIEIQSQAIKAYQRGPMSPSRFTRTMTGKE